MKRFLVIAVAAVALAGCGNPQTAVDAVGCATAVQAAVSTPPGLTDAQKGVAAGLAAASTPSCVGLSADAVAAMGQLKTGTPSVTTVPAKSS